MTKPTGAASFVADVQRRASQSVADVRSTQVFILEISEAYAFIRLQDWRRPLRFLKQISGDPPIQFGTTGFKRTIVDDKNPARHYTAFVFVGYWLPRPLAVIALWTWEILGFFRYRFHWSWRDLECGYIGIRHGRLVRRHGPAVLVGLIERDLVEKEIERLGD